MIYGFAASVLPVWLLLAPRDYLSTFMKLGTVAVLAVWSSSGRADAADAGAHEVHRRHRAWSCRARCFPFVFITIACGAISGFHALISSGTTPKLLDRENAIRSRRLRRDGHGDARGPHGADRRLRAGARPVLRHQRGMTKTAAEPAAVVAKVTARGLPRDASRAWSTLAAEHRREDDVRPRPAARRRSRSAWRRCSRRVFPARAWMASGITSRSCSRRCSS